MTLQIGNLIKFVPSTNAQLSPELREIMCAKDIIFLVVAVYPQEACRVVPWMFHNTERVPSGRWEPIQIPSTGRCNTYYIKFSSIEHIAKLEVSPKETYLWNTIQEYL